MNSRLYYFIHMFKCNILILIRSKWVIGWLMIFPLAMATFFYIGFGNLIKDDPDKFETIAVALVQSETTDDDTDNALSAYSFASVVKSVSEDSVSEDNDSKLFELNVVDEDEAIKMLEKGKVDGILYDTKEPSLTVKENGINQTILSSFIEQYNTDIDIIKNVYNENPNNVKTAIEMISDDMILLKEKNFNSDNTASPFLQYFYALISMTCLYGACICTDLLENIDASASDKGARYESAPVPKLMAVLAAECAGFIYELIVIVVLILYINFVLGLSFGNQVLPIIIISAFGALAGTTSGIFFSSLSGKKEYLRTLLPLAYSMLSSFLSGLMVGNLKQIIEVKAPIVNRLNPAALITDAFYVVNTYGAANSRYIMDLEILFIISVVFVILATICMRHSKR